MSRMKELRASLDRKLDVLEQQALALEAQLTQTRDQALQRFEQRKQDLRSALKQIEDDLHKSADVAEQAKQEVKAKLEGLRAQLDLGKVEAREAFEGQRTKILKALSDFESAVDHALKGAAVESGKVWEDLVGRAGSLEAELEALKHRFESEKSKQQVVLESKKQEWLAKLQAFKSQLKGKRDAVRDKADTFERDLREGLDQIKTSFRKLFD